jgi:uncharacterized membrane-anchored protein YhcB (DUF1043 family)
MIVPFGVAVASALIVGMAVGIVVGLFLMRPPAAPPSENEVLHSRMDTLTNEVQDGFDRQHDDLVEIATTASRIEVAVKREAVTSE